MDELNKLGEQLYGDKWPDVLRLNARRMIGEKDAKPEDLTPEEVKLLMHGLRVLKDNLDRSRRQSRRYLK